MGGVYPPPQVEPPTGHRAVNPPEVNFFWSAFLLEAVLSRNASVSKPFRRLGVYGMWGGVGLENWLVYT